MPAEILIKPRKDRAAVAVITRTKDRPMLLRRAVDSVLSQTFTDWLHVVVNDGGDATAVARLLDDRAEAYAGRLLLISYPQSRGMEAASNAGIQASESEFLLIHDDDDSLQAVFLETVVGYMRDAQRPGIEGVVSLVNMIHEYVHDDRISELRRELFRHLSGCIRIAEMARENQFPPVSFLYRRKVLAEIGAYDETLPVLGDWDFNLRFLARFDIGVVDKALANYHQRPSAKAGDQANSVYAEHSQHALYDGLIRNAHWRTAEERGFPMTALTMASAGPHPGRRPGARAFDWLYAIPLVRPTVRYLRSKGLLLGLTRDL